MIHVFDPGRTDPNGKPERAEPTGRWYLSNDQLWIEMDYGYMLVPEYETETVKVLMVFDRDIKKARYLTEKPMQRRFFNENEIIEVNS